MRRQSLLNYLLPLLLVTLVASAYTYFAGQNYKLTPSIGAQTSGLVQLRGDYYVTVALVELSENSPDGSPWDNISESGPDIYAEIFWKSNRIYRSTTKQDTFVAKWSNAELNLRSMALGGGNASMDDLIHAARLNIKPEEQIEVRVMDADVLGDTPAGSKQFTTTELKLGDTTYEFPEPGIKRMVIRVSDMAQAVDPLR